MIAKAGSKEYITKSDLDKAVKTILNNMKALFENLKVAIRNLGKNEPDHQ
jgi:nucleoid DNA-binding protein